MKANFWYITYEIIWITIIALLANFIFELKIDFLLNFDNLKIIKVFLLIISIGFYGYYFFNFKKSFDKAKEKDIENNLAFQLALKTNTDIPVRQNIDYYFQIERSNNPKYTWILACSIVFLICYTYKWDSLF